MTPYLFDISKKRILITGSTQGLGYQMARGFLDLRATVILNGRSAEKLHKAAITLRNCASQPEEFSFNVTSETEVRSAVREIEKGGGIDVLINNAGIQRRVSLDKVELSTWQEILAINLTGAMLVSREVVRGMIRRQAGKIINMCSLMSDFGRPTTGAYTAAKGGLKMLTKAMCADWAQYNIQINAIGPGYFSTEMTRPLSEDSEFDNWVKSRTPSRRWGRPEELIGAAVFLSSDASSFINGQILYVDGGMSSVL